ncbi:ABC transporter permease [Phytohabitans suffuscus]|uniref:ABC transporter permease n=1 Tax=Phytohabitans suffuscus TaxID=624315 RepID=A0A6F8YU72_9ACTN|nr:ABC transporter permease [Phytohabitans suffuscus]BCB89596.1 ABC transporter permease [Phytohabitans suffuscus]
MEATITPNLRYAAVLLILAAGAAALAAAARLGVGRQVVTASLRATAQLAAVSAVIVVVLRSWGLTAAFVALMLLVAVVTSARRVGRGHRTLLAGTAVAAGAVPIVALLLASGVVPRTPIAVVPVAGILIGGAMTATSLAGRRAMDTLRGRYGEVEAALALGLTDRDAVLLVCRPSAADALLPALDQTRTVGLVTLPGAFVGVLLGGASPIQAGAAQLLVLVGLLAVEVIAVVVVVELVARKLIPWPTR